MKNIMFLLIYFCMHTIIIIFKFFYLSNYINNNKNVITFEINL